MAGGARQPAIMLDPAASPARHPVSARAVALALLLIPANVYWVQHSELITGAAHATMASLLYTAVLTLLVVVAANGLVRRLAPRWAMAPGELLVVYAMVSLATAVAGHDQVEVLVTLIAYPYFYATPENRWEQLFRPYLDPRLVVDQPELLRGFWQGWSSFWRPETMAAFARPLACWLLFAAALYGTMLCLNLIFRPRWSRAERLSYPLIELPEQLATHPAALFRGRVFWAGFALAAVIDLLNGLHALWPALPHVTVTAYDLQPHLGSPFLRAMGYLPVSAYPWIIGLGYLLPKDYLLSCCVFFWIWKLEYAYGGVYARGSRFPYVFEQSFGAYLGIALFAVAMARHHLRAVVAEALGRPGDEPSGVPRMVVAGLIVGLFTLLLMGHAAGLDWGLAVGFFVLYLAIGTAVSRMRAEMGVPAHDLMASGPDRMLTYTLGGAALGPRNLTAFALTWWLNRANRSHPMPHQIEGLELGARHGAGDLRMAGALFVAAVAGFAVGFVCVLHLGYRHGLAGSPTDGSYLGRDAWTFLAAQLTNPRRGDPGVLAAIGVGAAGALVMLRLRTQFLWWPLHPIGYAVSSYYSGAILWLPLLVAWVIKTGVLRFGGLRLFRRWLPFFLGLILGEFVVGGAWTIVGTATGLSTYRFWAY